MTQDTKAAQALELFNQLWFQEQIKSSSIQPIENLELVELIRSKLSQQVEQEESVREIRIPVVERRLIDEVLNGWKHTNGEYSFNFRTGVEWGVSHAMRDKTHGIIQYMQSALKSPPQPAPEVVELEEAMKIVDGQEHTLHFTSLETHTPNSTDKMIPYVIAIERAARNWLHLQRQRL